MAHCVHCQERFGESMRFRLSLSPLLALVQRRENLVSVKNHLGPQMLQNQDEIKEEQN